MKTNNYDKKHKQYLERHSNDYLQSIKRVNNQKYRNTVGYDYNIIPSFGESISNNNQNFRNSLDLDIARNFIQKLTQSKKNQSSSYLRLKNTLNDLEIKLSNAKKQLSTKKNILDDIQSDKQSQEQSIQLLMNVNNKNNLRRHKQNTSHEKANEKQSGQSTHTLPSMTISLPQSKYSRTYYIQQIIRALTKQQKEAYQHLHISIKVIKSLPNFQPLSFMEIQDRKVSLPKKKDDKRKTLVIDIDETILHCQEQSNGSFDFMLPIKLQNEQFANAYITLRPYAISFLKRMSKLFQIIAFTASHQSYADVVLDEIDPDRCLIQHRLYRSSCFQIHPNIYTKDLRVINRDLSQMVLVDNAPYSYIFQLQNGIPILPFYQGEDYQLLKLQKYLEKVSKCNDVRELNKSTFQLHQYGKFAAVQDLAKRLYSNKR